MVWAAHLMYFIFFVKTIPWIKNEMFDRLILRSTMNLSSLQSLKESEGEGIDSLIFCYNTFVAGTKAYFYN